MVWKRFDVSNVHFTGHVLCEVPFVWLICSGVVCILLQNTARVLCTACMIKAITLSFVVKLMSWSSMCC